jgi:LysM repeat protein
MAKPDPKNPKTAVRVQSGDTLSAIAKANNLTLSEIKALNPNIMNDPKYNKGNKIFSNTKINIAPRTSLGTSLTNENTGVFIDHSDEF